MGCLAGEVEKLILLMPTRATHSQKVKEITTPPGRGLRPIECTGVGVGVGVVTLLLKSVYVWNSNQLPGEGRIAQTRVTRKLVLLPATPGSFLNYSNFGFVVT